MVHLVFVIGTRAQLVKMAPVVLAAVEAGVSHEVLLTGQHKESMSELATDLGVGAYAREGSLPTEHATMGSLLGWFPVSLLQCIKYLLRHSQRGEAKVVVHGDTASTLLGAVAGRFSGVSVAHVESGLSSGSFWNPFPEELIRQMVSRLSSLALCPDVESARRMERRGGCKVVETGGNTIIDAVRLATEKVGFTGASVASPAIVVSLHRFENIMRAGRLRFLVETILRISRNHRIQFVLHPPTERKLIDMGLLHTLEQAKGVELLPRMAYSQFMKLLVNSYAVITDGGSNQEELELLGIPTIILRDRTERANGLGENAVLEPQLPCGLVDYIESGACRDLRRPSRVSAASSPSRVVLAALMMEPER